MPGKSRVQRAIEAEDVPPLCQRLGIDPTKYHKALDRRAHDYALLGASDEEIADMIGVHRETFVTWAVEKPSLSKALARARYEAPARIVKSLHRAANGYKHRETKLNVVNGKLEKTDVTKAYPPNVQAATLILANRASKHWKDTKTVEHAGTINLAALVEGMYATPAADPKVIEGEAIVRSPPTDEPNAAE